MNKKQKWLYLLSVFVFLASSFSFAPIFAQTATLSVSLDTLNVFGEVIYGGGAPLTGVAMTSAVSGTATGTMNYYFYCNAPNDDSTEVVSGYAHSIIGTSSTTVTTPNGICDSIYANIGTYLAKVIVQRGGVAAEERRTVTVSSPLPQLDLKIRPLGASNWLDPNYDWTIYLDYNTAAEIRWTFSGADYCTMSGDWSGTKTVPGQESTGNLTESKTYIYTLECNTSSGPLTDTVMASVAPPTLFGSISANPSSGIAPLSGVVLAANVTGGTAVGTINYTFYCNRSDTGTNITSGYVYKLDGTNLLTVPTPSDACNSVYANVGNYTAKVIIERGGIAVEYRTPVTVNAPPRPIVNLTADSTNIPHNSSTMLRWTVSNATSCTPSAGPTNWTSSGGKSVPTGTWPTGNLTGPANYAYALTCTGPGGTGSGSVTVGVGAPPPPPGVRLRANGSDFPITVPYGSTVNLEWQTIGDTVRCVASGDWSGEKNHNSGQEYTGNLFGPDQYIYVLTCYDAVNQSGWDDAMVNALEEAPAIDSFQANPSSVNHGSASELSWTSTRATSCSIAGGITRTGLLPDGSISTGNLTSTQNYTLTCSNSGGQDSRSLAVTVGTAPAPTLTFQANTTNVAYGGSVTLTWDSENATSCEASSFTDKWVGARMPDGSQTVYNLREDDQFSLDCTGTGGTVSRSIDISVGDPPLVNVNIMAKPAAQSNYSTGDITVNCGTAVDLRWEVTGAIGCEAYGDWSGSKSSIGGTYRTQGLREGKYTYWLFCYNDEDFSEDGVYVTVGKCPENLPIIFENPINQGDFRNIFNSLSGLIRMIAVALAAIMIIISGIIILTSIDDRERLNKGKNMLKWALIGLAIALASSFIIGFIEELIN